MSDNNDDPARTRGGAFARGDRVRIGSGRLQGLSGVITRLSNRFDFVIAIDDWPSGVYLTVVGDAARSVEREAHDI
jgi:hypothetical protein